ncbi:MAG: hypothetical protein IJW75_00370 [Alphaproteobacteria bacterium]|nr:hypothetical protein [Alphaproteobacteria bacterium]
MFELNNVLELVKIYVNKHNLCNTAQLIMLNFDNRLEYAKICLEAGNQLCNTAQMMLLAYIIAKA